MREDPGRVKYRVHPSVVLKPDGDDAVVLHLGTHQYYELNGTARFVWERLAAGASASDLVRALAHQYALPTETAEGTVTELLQSLVAEGLVQVVGGRRRDRVWRKLFGAA